jgi:hypothetical protein
MEAEAAEERGPHCGGTGGVRNLPPLLFGVIAKTPSRCARLDSGWRLSRHGHCRVAGELYYLFFRPAAVVHWIAIASAYEGAVAAIG